jgi:hypothetical protein
VSVPAPPPKPRLSVLACRTCLDYPYAQSESPEDFKLWLPAYKAEVGGPRLRILCFPNAGSAENIFTGPAVGKDKKRCAV